MVTDAVGGWATDGDQSKRMAEGPQETAWPTPLLIIGSSRAGCSSCVPSGLGYLRMETPQPL